MTAKVVMEKPLQKFQKTLKAEFEGKQLIAVTVDGEELRPRKVKAHPVNAFKTEPSIEVSEEKSCLITILDTQGSWSYEYPQGG